MFDLSDEHRRVLENPAEFQFTPPKETHPMARTRTRSYTDYLVEKQLRLARSMGWNPDANDGQTQLSSIAEAIADALNPRNSETVQFSEMEISDARATEIIGELGLSASDTQQFSSHQTDEELVDDLLKSIGFQL